MDIFQTLMTLKGLCKHWIYFQQYFPATVKPRDDFLRGESFERLVFPALITKWFAG